MKIKTNPNNVQPAVKIDGKLNEELIKWLKIDYAKSLGFHSKAHFITNAARDLMLKYRTQKYMVTGKNNNIFSVRDLYEEKTISVMINKEKNVLQSSLCEDIASLSCDHVIAVWNAPIFARYLSEKKIHSCVINENWVKS